MISSRPAKRVKAPGPDGLSGSGHSMKEDSGLTGKTETRISGRSLSSDIAFYGLRANGSHAVNGTRYAVCRIKADEFGNVPSRIYISGDVRVCGGDVYVIEKVDGLIVDGFIQTKAKKGAELIVKNGATKNAIAFRVIGAGNRKIKIAKNAKKFVYSDFIS